MPVADSVVELFVVFDQAWKLVGFSLIFICWDNCSSGTYFKFTLSHSIIRMMKNSLC